MNENIYEMNENLRAKKGVVTFLLASGVVLVIWGIYLFFISISQFNFKDAKELGVYGLIGDYIGGVVGTLFSLAGYTLLYLTLQNQKEAFQKERFDSRFIDLIKFHRENVSEFEIRDIYYLNDKEKKKINIEYIKNRKAVRHILYDIQKCIEICSFYFESKECKDIYSEEYLEILKKNETILDRNIDLVELAKLNISYLVVFFGLSREGKMILNKMFKDKYIEDFYIPLINYLSLVPILISIHHKKWEEIHKLENRIEILECIMKLRNTKMNTQDSYYKSSQCKHYYNERYYKYFGGHQLRLGHYFRHLFQAINYVNNNLDFTFEEKYNYVKLLRAQLSTQEQALVFFNSISFIGEAWEFSPDFNKSVNCTSKRVILINHQLITKYNFIKNLPGEYLLNNIEYRKYYPLVVYEGEMESKEKEMIRKYYY